MRTLCAHGAWWDARRRSRARSGRTAGPHSAGARSEQRIVRAVARAPQSVQRGALGDAKRGANGRARAVRAVAVAIRWVRVIVDKVPTVTHSSRKVGVRGIDACVDDKDVHRRARRRRFEARVERQRGLVEPIEAPGRRGLEHARVCSAGIDVHLNVIHDVRANRLEVSDALACHRAREAQRDRGERARHVDGADRQSAERVARAQREGRARLRANRPKCNVCGFGKRDDAAPYVASRGERCGCEEGERREPHVAPGGGQIPYELFLTNFSRPLRVFKLA